MTVRMLEAVKSGARACVVREFLISPQVHQLMKQVLQTRNGTTVVRDVPPPPCPPGGVLVRSAYSVISSGTERARVALSQQSLLGKARARPDLVREVIARAQVEGPRATLDAVQRRLREETPVGYSCAGRVLEVGEYVRGLQPGDLVACAGAGHANHAEFVSVPANLCARVPEGVRLESAAFVTIAAIALHGVRVADVRVGDRVAVVGCGLVGQIALRLLRCAGAETLALDIDAQRVEDARRGGAREAVVIEGDAAARIPEPFRLGCDQVLVTAAARSNDPLLLGAQILRDRGTLVLVGDVPVELPRAPLYDKELSFRVSRSYGPGRYDLEYEERGLDYPAGYVRWTEQRNMEAVIALLEHGALELEDLIDEIVPVDDAPRAYARLTGNGGRPPRGALVIAFGEQPRRASRILTASRESPAARSKRAVGRAEALRIGLIGPGSFASRVIVPALRGAGAELELVGGGAGPSAEAAMRTLGFSRVAADADAVIADEQVDAVVVSARHSSHASLVTRALEAGKHVFCEKPLALTSDELDAVLVAEAASPGILAVGFNRRFSPHLRTAREFLVGERGRMLAAYRVSAGQLAPDHWASDLSQGGGRAIGEGCHFVDCLRYLVGEPIVEVHCAGYGADDAALQAWENLAITLRFRDGSVGSVVYVADGSRRLAKERLEAFSGDRTAVLDDYRNLELLTSRGRRSTRLRKQDKGHAAELEAFVAAARSGEPPVPVAELANVSLATLAVVESLRTGAPVELRATPVSAGAANSSA